MGGALGVFSKIVFDEKREEVKTEEVDPRRRNSLAYDIHKYFNQGGLNYNQIVEEIRRERERTMTSKMRRANRLNKYAKVGEEILQGNMRSLKNQVVTNYLRINRQYPEQGGNTLMHFICMQGYFEMLEFLDDPQNHSAFDDVQLHFEIKNDRNRTPLMMCFTPPTATYLAQRYGVKEDGAPKMKQPDHIEVASDWISPGTQQQREEMICRLIRRNVSVTDKDFQDFTCLHYAAMWGWLQATKALLRAGAEINAFNIQQRTPLMLAAEFVRNDVVQVLTLNKLLKINLRDEEGQTALLLACGKGDAAAKIVKYLCMNGADVNLETLKSVTPLYVACSLQAIQVS
jgi:hypothetical protein